VRRIFAVVALIAACARHHHATAPAPRPPDPIEADVNALVSAGWEAAKVTPAPLAADDEYVRRVTLDLTGAVPTSAETEAFLKAPDRAALVDRLLATPAFAAHLADRLGALLANINEKDKQRELLHDWLAAAIARGDGWDTIARALLTATGEGGDAIFVVTHAGMGGSPEATAAATARVFLGLQLQCAQCHDHPYDPRWKQEDFWGLAAYFARTKAKYDKDDKTFSLADVPKGEAKMKKHSTGEMVTVAPKFLGRDLPVAAGSTRRQALAGAIIASDLFAKEAVNRVWADLLGRGVVDPYDDLGDENDPDHPKLLVSLAADFVGHGYDLRRLVRTIVLSDAYQRSSRGGTGDDPEKVFARAPVRALTPEQLFRSLTVASGLSGDDNPGVAALVERQQREYQFVFGDDEMSSVDSFDGNVPQALLLFNGELTNRGSKAAPGSTLETILDAHADFRDRIDALFVVAYARKATDAEVAKIMPRVDRTKKSWEDLFFALLSSTEFTTNH
jgi:hypothetical protein